MTQILVVISGVISIIVGLWKYFSRRAAERRKNADQARKDLDEAKKNDSPSDFLDAFGHRM